MNSVNFSELKSLSHGKGQSWYHLILVPRARCPVFKYEFSKKVCDEAIVSVCKQHAIDLFTFEVMPDHVHLFISCPPRLSIARLYAIIKGGTSYYVRSKMPWLKRYPALWSRGAFFRSVGNVSAETVRKYIDESPGNQWIDEVYKQQKLN